MPHGHSHDEVPRASERTSLVLWVLVGVILTGVLVGAVATWPSTVNVIGSQQYLEDGSHWATATVVAFDEDTLMITARLAGEDGTVEIQSPGITGTEFAPGDELSVVVLGTGDVIFSDYKRSAPLLAMVIVFVLAVLLVARWRGAGALLGLLLAFGVVVFYTVPALIDGQPPIIVGLVTGAGALALLLYIAHGFNARTTTAYLGTIAGLVVTALLGSWAVSAARIPGVPGEAEVNVSFVASAISLSGLALCGVMLAGLGILNDVTVTQASAVWELRRARPDLARREVYSRGMRVGRDHIASTVYTIAFAYVGASLPLIVLITVYNNSLTNAITSSEIAGEVVRTLVGSLGLVLAVPLTTAIGALIAGPGATAPAEDSRRARRTQRDVESALED
ncbi:YibE/F family protein [Demequina sp.]|uniref:YibE/F family protein n=1 Tax=Demequina sp. TaxID=2050685 RepID=UPI003D0B7DB2